MKTIERTSQKARERPYVNSGSSHKGLKGELHGSTVRPPGWENTIAFQRRAGEKQRMRAKE